MKTPQNSDGIKSASNDNWRSNHEAEIIASKVPPSDDLESAIVETLPPTPHTAIVRGKGGATGVALDRSIRTGVKQLTLSRAAYQESTTVT